MSGEEGTIIRDPLTHCARPLLHDVYIAFPELCFQIINTAWSSPQEGAGDKHTSECRCRAVAEGCL